MKALKILLTLLVALMLLPSSVYATDNTTSNETTSEEPSPETNGTSEEPTFQSNETSTETNSTEPSGNLTETNSTQETAGNETSNQTSDNQTGNETSANQTSNQTSLLETELSLDYDGDIDEGQQIYIIAHYTHNGSHISAASIALSYNDETGAFNENETQYYYYFDEDSGYYEIGIAASKDGYETQTETIFIDVDPVEAQNDQTQNTTQTSNQTNQTQQNTTPTEKNARLSVEYNDYSTQPILFRAKYLDDQGSVIEGSSANLTVEKDGVSSIVSLEYVDGSYQYLFNESGKYRLKFFVWKSGYKTLFTEGDIRLELNESEQAKHVADIEIASNEIGKSDEEEISDPETYGLAALIEPGASAPTFSLTDNFIMSHIWSLYYTSFGTLLILLGMIAWKTRIISLTFRLPQMMLFLFILSFKVDSIEIKRDNKREPRRIELVKETIEIPIPKEIFSDRRKIGAILNMLMIISSTVAPFVTFAAAFTATTILTTSLLSPEVEAINTRTVDTQSEWKANGSVFTNATADQITDHFVLGDLELEHNLTNITINVSCQIGMENTCNNGLTGTSLTSLLEGVNDTLYVYNFTIAAGVAVTVRAFNNTTAGDLKGGNFTIIAKEIYILGNLSADNAGGLGGGGGLGGAAGAADGGGGGRGRAGGAAPNVTSSGGGGFAGNDGNNGAAGGAASGGGAGSGGSSGGGGSYGGAGGNDDNSISGSGGGGQGVEPGAGGLGVALGEPGVTYGNNNTDEATFLIGSGGSGAGSGGGGGGGRNAAGGPAGNAGQVGEAGGKGGGAIMLKARKIFISGNITVNGANGGKGGNGGDGGNGAVADGGGGGGGVGGGGGSGGTIIINATQVNITGRLNASGGNGGDGGIGSVAGGGDDGVAGARGAGGGGGRIKIFVNSSAQYNITGASIHFIGGASENPPVDGNNGTNNTNVTVGRMPLLPRFPDGTYNATFFSNVRKADWRNLLIRGDIPSSGTNVSVDAFTSDDNVTFSSSCGSGTLTTVGTNNDLTVSTTGCSNTRYLRVQLTLRRNATNTSTRFETPIAHFLNNTLETNVNITNLLVNSTVPASDKFYNRGIHSLNLTGTLIYNGSGESVPTETFTFNVTTARGGGSTFQGTNTTAADGRFEVIFTSVPQNVVDTYDSSTPNISETLDYNLTLNDSTLVNPTDVDNILDVDANYYLRSNNVLFTPLMRGDVQRVNATFADVQNLTVRANTWVNVSYISPNGTITHSANRSTSGTSGTADNFDQQIQNNGPTGTWTLNYSIDRTNLTANFNNSLASTQGGSFTLLRNITNSTLIAANIEGEGSTQFKIFNRGERIVINGTLLHADGGPLRVKTPDGNQTRTIRIQIFNNTYGTDINENTSVSPAVATGVFSVAITLSTDVALNDTYSNSTPNQTETREYDVRFYDNTTDTTSSTFGNDGNTSDQFDVDANLYLLNYSINATPEVFNRGEGVRMRGNIYGGRNQSYDNTVTMEIRNSGGTVEDSQSINTETNGYFDYSYNIDPTDTATNDFTGSPKDYNASHNNNRFVSLRSSHNISARIQLGNASSTINNKYLFNETLFNLGEAVNISFFLFNVRNTSYSNKSSIQVEVMSDSNGTEESITGLTSNANGFVETTYTIATGDKNTTNLVGSPKHINVTPPSSNTEFASDEGFNVSRIYRISNNTGTISNTFNYTSSVINRGHVQTMSGYFFFARGERVDKALTLDGESRDKNTSNIEQTISGESTNASGFFSTDVTHDSNDLVDALSNTRVKSVRLVDSNSNYISADGGTTNGTTSYNLSARLLVSTLGNGTINNDSSVNVTPAIYNRGEGTNWTGYIYLANGTLHRSQSSMNLTYKDSNGADQVTTTGESTDASAFIDTNLQLPTIATASANHQGHRYRITLVDSNNNTLTNDGSENGTRLGTFNVSSIYGYSSNSTCCNFDILVNRSSRVHNLGEGVNITFFVFFARNTSLASKTGINFTVTSDDIVNEESTTAETTDSSGKIEFLYTIAGGDKNTTIAPNAGTSPPRGSPKFIFLNHSNNDLSPDGGTTLRTTTQDSWNVTRTLFCDAHTESDVTLTKDDLNLDNRSREDTNETSTFIIAADVVETYGHCVNANNESLNGYTVSFRFLDPDNITAPGTSTSTDTTDSTGWTGRFRYSTQAPAGTWLAEVNTSDASGNSGGDNESISFISPYTGNLGKVCFIKSRIGSDIPKNRWQMNQDVTVRCQYRSVTNFNDTSVDTDSNDTRLDIIRLNNDGTETNIYDEVLMTRVSQGTYDYNVSLTLASNFTDDRVYKILSNAKISSRDVLGEGFFYIGDPQEEIDPLVLSVDPRAEVNEQVFFTATSMFLNATPRTGATISYNITYAHNRTQVFAGTMAEIGQGTYWGNATFTNSSTYILHVNTSNPSDSGSQISKSAIIRIVNRGLSAAQNNTLYQINSTTNTTSTLLSYYDQYNTLPWAISHWTFNEGNGTTPRDYVGGYNGAFQSNTTWTTGIYGKGVSFDGSDDLISVPDNSVFDFGSSADFSISMWFNTSDTGSQNKSLLAKRDGLTGTPGWSMKLTDSKNIQMEIGNGTYNASVTGTTPVNDSRWHHALATLDRDGNMTLYLDGRQIGSTSISSVGNVNNSENVQIGGASSSSTSSLSGYMDEVIIFNKALTPREVRFAYESGSDFLESNTTNTYLADINATVYDIKTIVQRLETQLSRLENFTNSTFFNNMTARFDRVDANLTEIDNNLTEIDTTLANLETRMNANFTDIRDRLTNINTTLVTVGNNLTNVNSTIHTEIDAINTTLSNLETRMNNNFTNIRDRLTLIDGNLTEIDSNLTEIDTSISNLDSNMSSNFTDIRSRLSNLNTTVREVGTNLTNTNNTLHSSLNAFYSEVHIDYLSCGASTEASETVLCRFTLQDNTGDYKNSIGLNYTVENSTNSVIFSGLVSNVNSRGQYNLSFRPNVTDSLYITVFNDTEEIADSFTLHLGNWTIEHQLTRSNTTTQLTEINSTTQNIWTRLTTIIQPLLNRFELFTNTTFFNNNTDEHRLTRTNLTTEIQSLNISQNTQEILDAIEANRENITRQFNIFADIPETVVRGQDNLITLYAVQFDGTPVDITTANYSVVSGDSVVINGTMSTSSNRANVTINLNSGNSTGEYQFRFNVSSSVNGKSLIWRGVERFSLVESRGGGLEIKGITPNLVSTNNTMRVALEAKLNGKFTTISNASVNITKLGGSSELYIAPTNLTINNGIAFRSHNFTQNGTYILEWNATVSGENRGAFEIVMASDFEDDLGSISKRIGDYNVTTFNSTPFNYTAGTNFTNVIWVEPAIANGEAYIIYRASNNNSATNFTGNLSLTNLEIINSSCFNCSGSDSLNASGRIVNFTFTEVRHEGYNLTVKLIKEDGKATLDVYTNGTFSNGSIVNGTRNASITYHGNSTVSSLPHKFDVMSARLGDTLFLSAEIMEDQLDVMIADLDDILSNFPISTSGGGGGGGSSTTIINNINESKALLEDTKLLLRNVSSKEDVDRIIGNIEQAKTKIKDSIQEVKDVDITGLAALFSGLESASTVTMLIGLTFLILVAGVFTYLLWRSRDEEWDFSKLLFWKMFGSSGKDDTADKLMAYSMMMNKKDQSDKVLKMAMMKDIIEGRKDPKAEPRKPEIDKDKLYHEIKEEIKREVIRRLEEK